MLAITTHFTFHAIVTFLFNISPDIGIFLLKRDLVFYFFLFIHGAFKGMVQWFVAVWSVFKLFLLGLKNFTACECFVRPVNNQPAIWAKLIPSTPFFLKQRPKNFDISLLNLKTTAFRNNEPDIQIKTSRFQQTVKKAIK